MTRWLIPFEPFKDIIDIKKQIDDIFVSRPFHSGLRPAFDNTFVPAVDVLDRKDRIVVRAEIPGVDKKDMTISISDDELVIKGEVKRESETDEKDYYHCERTYGTFIRTINLPTSVDKDKAKASYKDGILEITLPKSEIAKPKEIKVAVE